MVPFQKREQKNLSFPPFQEFKNMRLKHLTGFLKVPIPVHERTKSQGYLSCIMFSPNPFTRLFHLRLGINGSFEWLQNFLPPSVTDLYETNFHKSPASFITILTSPGHPAKLSPSFLLSSNSNPSWHKVSSLISSQGSWWLRQ